MTEQLIEFLRNRKGFISGEQISRSLGITRAGIWKRVNVLRQRGYLIEAVPSKGYKLLFGPDIPTKEEIKAVFKGDIIGREIVFYRTTSSTNDRAMEMGQLRRSVLARQYQHSSQQRMEGLEGTVIVADAQEQGRGRFGRDWVSPPGVNLYFTVLLEPPFAPERASILTLMAAVAVVSAIREHVGLNAVIKWPNDILVGNKKVGGILTEMKSDQDRINFVAVGIGLNVNMPSSMLPGNVRPHATSLKEEKGEYINRVKLLGVILAKLEHWYKNILKGKKKALLNEWMRLDSTSGKKVRVKSRNRIISGKAEGISDDGELIVRLFTGVVEKVHAGEVTILKDR